MLASVFFPLAGIALGAGGGALIGKTLNTGLDKKFITDVQDAIKPGNSAVLFIVSKENTGLLITALEPYKGKIFQSSFDSEAEEEIRRSLKQNLLREPSMISEDGGVPVVTSHMCKASVAYLGDFKYSMSLYPPNGKLHIDTEFNGSALKWTAGVDAGQVFVKEYCAMAVQRPNAFVRMTSLTEATRQSLPDPWPGVGCPCPRPFSHIWRATMAALTPVAQSVAGTPKNLRYSLGNVAIVSFRVTPSGAAQDDHVTAANTGLSWVEAILGVTPVSGTAGVADAPIVKKNTISKGPRKAALLALSPSRR